VLKAGEVAVTVVVELTQRCQFMYIDDTMRMNGECSSLFVSNVCYQRVRRPSVII